MRIIKTLKGGSLSKTVVLQGPTGNVVRKSISRKANREYGLVRWHSQVRKLQLMGRYIPEFTIQIANMGSNEDEFYYEIPYIEGSLNCAEALAAGEPINLMADQFVELLTKMSSFKFASIPGSLSVYIAEEIGSPLRIALNEIVNGTLPLSRDELSLFEASVSAAINLTNNLIDRFKNVDVAESMTHGNLTLENVLWNSRSKSILLIDPYAETYCETIMGDYSQLLQSTKSGYEYISSCYDAAPFSIGDYPIQKIPGYLCKFSDALEERVSNEAWFVEEHAILLLASQFSRMFPFKLVTSPRQGVAFMMHAINLLEKV